MNRLFVFLLIFHFFYEAAGQYEFQETPEIKANRMKWWTDSRFGMFIHFGLYSMAAEHAWYKSKHRLTNEEYQKYLDHFNPNLLDPVKWAETAKKAGMKYMVITTKHHDGFCLWDSEFTDYKITNTPYGKDLIKEVVKAFREQDIRVGFYYSLLDWHHPEYTTDHKHPLKNDPEYVSMDKERDMVIYQQYMQKQLTELMSNYGRIDHMFFDFSFVPQEGYAGKGRDEWNSPELLEIVRELQPACIINDRLDLMDVEGGWDFRTPEQFMPDEWVRYNGEKVAWETCQTLSGRWSYVGEENAEWKTTGQVIKMLIEVVSKGGNLLLNVGPNARGEMDPKSAGLLLEIGEWMHLHDRSIYNCTAAPEGIRVHDGNLLSYNPEKNVLYLHLLNWPFKEVSVKGILDQVKYAQFLHDGSEVKTREMEKGPWMKNENGKADYHTFSLPVQKPEIEIPVIEIFLY